MDSSDRRRRLLGPGMAVALLLVAFTWGDYVLGLAPPQMGDAHWRFATATAMAMPLWWALVGSLLLLWFAESDGRESVLRWGAILCLFQALLFLLALGLFPLDFVALRRDVQPDAQWTFRVAAARTALKLLTGVALFGWLALSGFRSAREEEGGGWGDDEDGRGQIPLIVGRDRD